MKKLKLMALELGATQVLSREQLKKLAAALTEVMTAAEVEPDVVSTTMTHME